MARLVTELLAYQLRVDHYKATELVILINNYYQPQDHALISQIMSTTEHYTRKELEVLGLLSLIKPSITEH